MKLKPNNLLVSNDFTVLLWVTIEAEAGMTIYGQCWGQVISAHCTSPLNVCKVCVCIRVRTISVSGIGIEPILAISVSNRC